MTQKAPDRIFAEFGYDMERGSFWAEPSDQSIEYVRADHALALVAAEREACAKIVYLYALKHGKKIPATYDRIRDRTNDDAQAALERLLHDTKTEWWNRGYKAARKQARNEALIDREGDNQ